MSQNYGREVPPPHKQATHRQVARYLVVVDSGGVRLARLFLDTREQVGEFDAGAEEVSGMIQGLSPTGDASGPEWDRPLAGHSAAERRAASVYVLTA
jgi:hypothetical protein